MAIQRFQMSFQMCVVMVLRLYALIAMAQEDAPFSFGARKLEPGSPPVITANATGEHGIGIRRETLQFEGRQLNVSWWYPANVTAGMAKYVSSGGLVGQAVQNAPLARSGRRYPLVLFSPGVGAHNDAYFFYCQNLASSGYIVVSINHLDASQLTPGSNVFAMAQAIVYMIQNNSSYTVWLLFSNWFRSTHFGLTYRPQEIQYVLNKAIAAATEPSSPFYNVMDTDNIGMVGHSLGGFYTLLKGAGFAIHCDTPLASNENNVENSILTEVSICAWPEARNLGSPTALHDPRIKAVIVLAAPFFIKPAIIPRSASAIKTPMMILTGNDPNFESTIQPQQQTYDAAQGPKYIVEINATNHLSVSEAYQFNANLSATMSAVNKENFAEKAQVYMVYSSAFFDTYLKGNNSNKQILHVRSSEYVADLKYSD
jgi:predicted dienelactone hydrolase